MASDSLPPATERSRTSHRRLNAQPVAANLWFQCSGPSSKLSTCPLGDRYKQSCAPPPGVANTCSRKPDSVLGEQRHRIGEFKCHLSTDEHLKSGLDVAAFVQRVQRFDRGNMGPVGSFARSEEPRAMV